jgi:replication factor A1
MLNLKEMIKEISRKSGLKEDEIKKLIEDKQLELSGLISEEGAAYIVGRELGVNLLKEKKMQLKIKNIVSGMRNVEIVAKVISISKPRIFEKNGKSGSVVNIILADETGRIRLSLWDEETALAEKIKPDDVVFVKSAYAKEDKKVGLELRLGKRGSIKKIDEEMHIEVKRDYERKNISDISDGEYAEIKACLIRIFPRNPFFEVCPKCKSRLERSENKFICKEHKEVEPEYKIFVSGIFDDGTGSIRSVFFKETAEKLFGKITDELRNIALKAMDYSAIYENFDGLGKEYILRGKVKKNEFNGTLEFIVDDICEVDVKKECEILLDKMNMNFNI